MLVHGYQELFFMSSTYYSSLFLGHHFRKKTKPNKTPFNGGCRSGFSCRHDALSPGPHTPALSAPRGGRIYHTCPRPSGSCPPERTPRPATFLPKKRIEVKKCNFPNQTKCFLSLFKID